MPTKVHLVKAMVFPVVIYGCKSWTIKKAEHWRIYTLKLWYCRRFLKVPWTARRSNQSIHYFAHLMWRVDSLEKTPMLGKIEGRRTRGQQRMKWLDGIVINSMDMNLSKLGKMMRDRKAWHAAVHGVSKSQIRLGNWTITSSHGLIDSRCWWIVQNNFSDGHHSDSACELNEPETRLRVLTAQWEGQEFVTGTKEKETKTISKQAE